MKRRTFDTLLSITGFILAAILLAAGGLLTWGGGFASSTVHDQLVAQQITFGDEASFTGECLAPLKEWAGKPVDSGAAANAYAGVIKCHMKSAYKGMGLDENETYASLGRVMGMDQASAEAKTLNAARDLAFKGETLATPQLGNTQDVALRAWLKKNGYNVSLSGQGDVQVLPTDNAQTLALFQKGDIDGAWLPEPWASRLVLEANAKVLLDESTLWPGGDFVTTNVIAETGYLAKYPGTIRSLIRANIAAIQWAKANPVAAKDAVQAQLLKWSGKKLSDAVINRAWDNLRLTWDPIATSLKTSANNAVKAGVLTNLGADGINGIYDLRLLNQVLKFEKLATVSANKLGLD